MDFRRITRRSVKTVCDELEQYPHVLQLYEYPPDFELPYFEVEKCTSDRLTVLQALDDVSARGLKPGSDDWRLQIKTELRKLSVGDFKKLFTCTEMSEQEEFVARRRDHVSHFMLRLAFCDAEDKRRWLISREVDLFRFRWMQLNSESQSKFLQLNNLNYEKVTAEDKTSIISKSNGMITFSDDYYKVPFIHVSDLIRARKVFLSCGFAFITSADIISVVMSSFRSKLSQSLAYARLKIHKVLDDPRIKGLVGGAGKNQRDIDYTKFIHNNKISIGDLDTLAKISYPLCMQQLHAKLRADHHLRHSGRQQYGLFLKGIGVTLEDAILFWKSEFTKKMDADKFEKSYAYNIRHNYGKEGKRANYAPQSCAKIITSNVGPGEHHGCPFKTMDSVSLQRTIQKAGLSLKGVADVVDLAKKGHYQLACSTYFQLSHNTDQYIVNHPNLYFDESQRVLSERGIKKEERADSTDTKPSTQQSDQMDDFEIITE